MAWFRRTRALDVQPARFIGFGPDDCSLYEFRTGTGAYVSLHEAYFESLVYQVGAPPDVVLTFVVGDGADPAMVANARIHFRLNDAFVMGWVSDQSEADYRGDRTVPHGQVAEFSWDGSRCFVLETIDDSIWVEAGSIEVSVQPIPTDELTSILARVAGV